MVVALALLFTSRSAFAQSGVRVYLTAKPADPANPKTKGQAPSIEATIINGSNVPFDKCTITQTGGKAPVTLKAISKREYTEGTDTIAIALVINGQEVWVGNDKVEPDPSAQYKGVLDNLSSAIDQLKLGEAGPPGSKGIIVSYSTGAEVKMPMSPLGSLNGSALGSQKDYRGKIGTDMVQGISMGIGELSKVSTVRKALIVVGDGTDTDNDVAAASLTEQRKLANKNGIDLFAVIYKSELSSPNNVITKLIPNAKTVNSIEGIKAEMTSIIEQMKDRYYLTFPGYDPKLGVGLSWDGKEHDLVVKIDQTELDAVPLAMVPKWSPPSSGGFPVWAIILIIVAVLLLLVVIGAKVFGSKAEPMPAPMPVVAAPAPLEAPKPLGPVKTVMIGQGGDEGGFPVVGWLVPLNGKHAYQTFRLRGGGTKIGTAPPADIVVDDGFMSTDHCHIHCSPSGFSLVDPGSTNGCYVNDRRVQKHDLVDNDMITLGKTSFKFKSIV
ncbi:MAG: FHA domain-containing protein [Kofleriaceae bacterium]